MDNFDFESDWKDFQFFLAAFGVLAYVIWLYTWGENIARAHPWLIAIILPLGLWVAHLSDNKKIT